MKPQVADSKLLVASDALRATSFSQDAIPSAVNDAALGGARTAFRNIVTRVVGWVRSLGPYAAIELILPGGSIVAVALWTYRHRRALRRSAVPQTVAARVVRAETPACVRPCTVQ